MQLTHKAIIRLLLVSLSVYLNGKFFFGTPQLPESYRKLYVLALFVFSLLGYVQGSKQRRLQ